MTKSNLRKNPREIALDIVMDITETKDDEARFSHIVLNKTLKEYDFLDKQDRAFITRICEGTLERLITIDYIINQYSKVKVKKMKPLIRSLLRISVYQVKYMDRSPDFAICNEAVKIAKKRGFYNLSGFVNGILRNIIRNPQSIVFPNEEKEPVKYLSTKYSAPEWMVSQFINQYSYEIAKLILEDSLVKKETTIRCNKNKVSVSDLEKKLISESVDVKEANYLPYALKISGYDSLDRLESFRQGLFTIQDESSMLVGEIASPKKNSLIVDVCAAPGGKSIHLAEKLENTGHVISRDLSQHKVNLINENVERLGIDNISLQAFNALELDKNLINKADLVLVDAPCSGLGVISKKPDIKYNMTPESQKNLVELQREILKVASQYVKPGANLIYSTCTINKEENEGNVKFFLDNFPFKLTSIDSLLPKELRNDDSKEGFLTLIPGVNKCDGFFIAKFTRIDS